MFSCRRNFASAQGDTFCTGIRGPFFSFLVAMLPVAACGPIVYGRCTVQIVATVFLCNAFE